MKKHQTKFNEIKNLLKNKLGEDLVTYEEHGTEFIEIKNTEFWLTIDDNEFTVGFGFNHTHFSEDYENLEEGIIQAIDILTNRIKTTDYIKGRTIFKTVIEIEYPNLKLVNIGESSLLFYAFWKKTKIQNSFSNTILNKKEIEHEINKIIN
jgi:hypothetical protein